MIDFKNLTPEQITAACEEAVRQCDAAIERIIATAAVERTFDNTFVALEAAVDHVMQVEGTHGFMAYVAEDDALRETARDWEQRLGKYAVDLGFREDLYSAIKEYGETAEAAALNGDEKRLLDRTMLDYKRNGFDLEPEGRARVRELMNRLVELGTDFRKAIDTWDDGIVATREEPFSLEFDLSRPLQEITEELTAQAERVYLRCVLEKYRGRIAACAAHSGLSRRSISEKLRRYRIDKADFKPHVRRRQETGLASGQG